MRTEIQEYIVRNYFELLKIAKRITRGHELHNDLLNDIILQMYERESEIKLKTYEDNDIKYDPVRWLGSKIRKREGL